MTVTIIVNLFGYASIENVVENFRALRQLQSSVNIVIWWSSPSPDVAQVVHFFEST